MLEQLQQLKYCREFFSAIMILLTILGGVAHAACSRVIQVPVAPTGNSVLQNDSNINGVYPDVLRELGLKVGCRFEFQMVPRNRLSTMFAQGLGADILMPATQTKERDQLGIFVPFMQMRLAVFTLKSSNIQIKNTKALLANKSLRSIVVRSYSFGDQYTALIQQLENQKRIVYANDPLMLARMLKAKRGDFAVILPTILLSSIFEDPEMKEFQNSIRFMELDDLTPIYSGIYLSSRSLSHSDSAELLGMFKLMDKTMLRRLYQKYSPPEIFKLYRFDS